MIFIVKDEHNEARDTTLAKHVMNVHLNALRTQEENEGELSLKFLKKFIAYCRTRCGPRLSEASAEKLKNRYVLMRGGTREAESHSDKRLAIPINELENKSLILLLRKSLLSLSKYNSIMSLIL